MLWLTDSCQNKVSTDEYRRLRLKAHEGRVF